MPNSSHEDQLIRYHVLISGKVQGVGYRMSVLQAANKFNLKGWVRNLPDGSVEAIFEGNLINTEQIIRWCRQGNSTAVVENIVVEQQMPEAIQTFEIRR